MADLLPDVDGHCHSPSHPNTPTGTVGFGDIHAVTTSEYIFVIILILINAVSASLSDPHPSATC